jgi:quercetin dioxygenase-like cupin family protein
VNSGEIQIVDGATGPVLPIVEGDGEARAIIWPGLGARSRSLHRLSLGSGASTVRLKHPSDAVYYVIAGVGSVRDSEGGDSEQLRPGSMFHVDAGTAYVVTAADDGIELVGGPAPADDELYSSLGQGG